MRSYDYWSIFYAIIFVIGTILVALSIFEFKDTNILILSCTVVLYCLMEMNHYSILKKLDPVMKIPEEKKP